MAQLSLMASPKFSVAIVGGGIGGAILAIALSKHSDIQFDIYEAAAGFTEIGASVGIFGRSLTAIKHLGLVEELGKIVTAGSLTGQAHTIQYRKSDVSPKGFHYATRSVQTTSAATGTYYRPRLLETLTSLLPEGCREKYVHFSKRLHNYVQSSDGVTLHFEDGSTAVCDLLVGADGIKSPTRYAMYTEIASKETDEGERKRILEKAVPRWSGMVAFRGMVPFDQADTLGEKHPCCTHRQIHTGKAAHVVALPVRTEGKIDVNAYATKPSIPEHIGFQPDELRHTPWPAHRPWVEETTPEAMLEAFAEFEDQALVLVKFIKRPSRWAIHHLDPLPYFTNGRVCLVGDAAHAPPPHQGQGANQAIESAYILGRILGSARTTKETIPLALKAYEQARRPRANDVITISQKTGLMCEFLVEPFNDTDKLKEIFEGPWSKWLFVGDCDDDVRTAVEWMKSAQMKSDM